MFFADLLEPKRGPLRMHVPTPHEGKPDVRIKEIQRVHRSVHPFVGQVYLWAFENDEGEPHSFGTWALALQ